MDNFVKKCKIERNNIFGRYITAAVDIGAGETIFLEQPVVILPFAEEKRCTNCLKLTDEFCRICLIFPLCNNCTQHNEYDCNLFAGKKDVIKIGELQKYGEVYGILKCLMLRENPETSKYFEMLMQLEAHLEERRNTEIWTDQCRKVVEPILSSGLTEHLRESASINEELLQKLCGLIDVNCFEIRAPDQDAMRGVYLRASLLAHHCIANTIIAIDDKYQMKIYANRDISQDEMLYYCYTNVLLGTEERRQSLKVGKYFDCTCERCVDPTELGSHMSSLICSPCAGKQLDGCMVKQQGKWQCLMCENTLKSEWVESILERAKEEIFHAKDDVYRYELLLAKLSRFLHRNHYLMIDLKQNIAAILRSIISNLAHRPGQKVYERKVHLCHEIMAVLHIIQPGISRLKAIALYELCSSSAELGRLRFGENDLSESALLSILQQSETTLRESIKMLLYEPVETPEGQLAKSMLKELKGLQNDIKLVQPKK